MKLSYGDGFKYVMIALGAFWIILAIFLGTICYIRM